MNIGGKKRPVKFHASISKDWVQGVSSTYDPDYLWEATLASPQDAVEALRAALPQVTKDVPWPHGYLLAILHLGPRGGIYHVTLERTQDHPTPDALLKRLAARQ